ncbi:MAG: ribonuclease R [Saprospiraceae bacterium]|nr:ribonuclease R [Saprospiraceae bacterium]
MKKRKKKKVTLLSSNQILKFFATHPEKAYGLSAIKRKLHLEKLGDLENILQQLEKKKLLERISPGKWLYKGLISSGKKQKEELLEGTVDMARAGFAYILCKGVSRDIFVSAKNLNGAMDGDFVQVRLTRIYVNKPEGVVQKIITRSKSQFVGVYRSYKNHDIVIVDEYPQVMEIYVKNDSQIEINDFDRAIVEITKWKSRPGDRMMGVITENLGREKTIDMEMKSIIAENGFPLHFPESVTKEAEEIVESVSDLKNRKDFRKICTFTIDPIDAKDFDDAISVQINSDKSIDIGVHIADVSYYVKPDSALDKEALRRGNSVYLVDRVIPMLPEKLSNELCSLRPKEDKLTFSVVFTFDEHGNIKKHWIGRTIIHSQKRFSYEEVQKILLAKKGILRKELELVNSLAKKIRTERLKNGAIDFESEEVRFKLDELGQPVQIYIKERFDAHKLIEEFMLLANKYVATHMAFKNKVIPIPFVYRIHDIPDPDKLEDFMFFAREMGVKLDLSTPKKVAKSLNNLAELVRSNPDLQILQPLAIRTMAKAEYNPDNIGHYGLAFDNYTHFTSPIRRYSDLIVHRILFDNLLAEKRYRLDSLQAQCRHITTQEKKAMDAERASTKYFQVLYMSKFVGKEFEGRITGMNDRGFYIELIQTKCEGVLPLSEIPYELEVAGNRLSANSSTSNLEWKIGDKIKIVVLTADIDSRELILGLPKSN